MSALKKNIRRQIDSSGQLLINAASIVKNAEFFDERPGGSMAWTLNHLTALQDWSINRVFLETEPVWTRAEREAFKGGRAIAARDREFYGDKSQIIDVFTNSQFETLKTLERFDEERWDVSTPSGCRFPSYGTLWEHLGSHNFWHLGALSVAYPDLTSILQVAPRHYAVDLDEMTE